MDSNSNGQNSQRPTRPGMRQPTTSTLRPRVTRIPTAQTARTANTANTATTSGRDQGYSLAGPGPSDKPAPGERKTYVDERYRKLNPHYDQPESNPTFSLGRALPRTIRGWQDGKKHDPGRRPAGVEGRQKGETERAPQLENTDDRAGRTDEQENTRPQAHRGTTMTSVREQDEQGGDQGVITDSAAYVTSPNGSEDEKTLADEEEPMEEQPLPYNKWALLRKKFQDPLGEWLGTTITVTLGLCSNLSVATSSDPAGTYQSMYWGWGFAVMLGIYISGGASGAHLNPAISIMLSAYRGFPARRVPVFVFFQVLGAFTGGIIAIAIYRDTILYMDGGLLPASTGIYIYTQPQTWVKPATAFFTEVLGTGILACSILALGDDSNSPPGAGTHAVVIGFLVVALLMALGSNTGGALNPARDFGPRLAAMALGYPTSVFSAGNNWWIWGGWCSTILGSLLGAGVYDACIFRGSESPINFSTKQWQDEGRKAEISFWSMFRQNTKADDLQTKLENGEA